MDLGNEDLNSILTPFQLDGSPQRDIRHRRPDLRVGRGVARPPGRVDGQARLPVAAAGPGGKDGHGSLAVVQQEDPVQPAACARGNTFLGQPVQEQLGRKKDFVPSDFSEAVLGKAAPSNICSIFRAELVRYGATKLYCQKSKRA